MRSTRKAVPVAVPVSHAEEGVAPHTTQALALPSAPQVLVRQGAGGAGPNEGQSAGLQEQCRAIWV